MDALEIERAHLVGNSMGGRVAIEVGLREPARVGGLGAALPRAGVRAPRLPAARAAAAPGARPAAALARARADREAVLVDVRRPRPRRPERRRRRGRRVRAHLPLGRRAARVPGQRALDLPRPPVRPRRPLPAHGRARAAGAVRLGLARQADPAGLRPPRRALAAAGRADPCSRAAATCPRSSAPSARTACSRASSRASTRSAPRRSSALRPSRARARSRRATIAAGGEHAAARCRPRRARSCRAASRSGCSSRAPGAT